jgi:uncharacterized paraquat-inducible protein A
MPNQTWHDDEEDWSESGGDYVDDDGDGDSAADDDSIPCPECGADVYADLDHCPRCGHWLTDADRESQQTGLFATRRVRLIAAGLLAVFVLGMLAELLLW